MRRLFAHRNFRLLFVGLVASYIGDWLLMLVLGIWVKQITGSSGAAGLTMFFIAAPMFAAPLLGHVVDRFRRRSFLVVANLLSAAALLPLLSGSHVVVIYLVAMAYGVSDVVLSAGLSGLLKELLADDELVDANGALQTVRQGLRLVGPLAGAAIFAAFGGGVVAVIDAVSFVVAAGMILLIRLEERKPERTEQHWTAEVTAGARHMFSERALRRGAISLGCAVFALGMIESIGFELNDKGLHRPPEFISVLVSAMGVGAVIGGLLAARLVRRTGELGTVGLCLMLVGMVCVALTVPVLGVVLVAMAFAGLFLTVSSVADSTLVQRHTPAPLMGRAAAAFEAMVGIPQTLSVALGAGLVSLVDYRALLVVIAAVVVLSGAYAWIGRRLSPASTPTPEPTEPTESTEPTEPTESTEPTEPTEPTGAAR